MIHRLLKQVEEITTLVRQRNLYQVFLEQRYQRHTIARLEHLDSLGLDIRGKHVLEVGAGIGEHTLFYLHRGCPVVATDGRAELVRFIRDRLGIPAFVLDVERDIRQLLTLGKFDILHCYGLLYHISNPAEFIRYTSAVTETIFLETCVTPGYENTLRIITEDRRNIWEATSGRGCLPTRTWVFETLKQHFAYVYCPRTQPRHVEFPISWEQAAYEPLHLIRAVFIASHHPLSNDKLVDHVPTRYELE